MDLWGFGGHIERWERENTGLCVRNPSPDVKCVLPGVTFPLRERRYSDSQCLLSLFCSVLGPCHSEPAPAPAALYCPRACEKFRISGPSPKILNPDFNKTPGYSCTCESLRSSDPGAVCSTIGLL